jgi:hypothetical protein
MHLINDISLLVRLGKNGILNHLGSECDLAISAVRLSQYSGPIHQSINRYCPLVQQLFSDEGCAAWRNGKSTYLSLGDLDTLYLAKTKDIMLLCSDKDFKLQEMAEQEGIQHEGTDSFFRRMIEDHSAINLYNLVKAI